MDKINGLNYLIKSLSPSVSVPSDVEGKWQLFRALANMRHAEPVSVGFLAAQDELLQSIIAENGIKDIADMQPVRNNL